MLFGLPFSHFSLINTVRFLVNSIFALWSIMSIPIVRSHFHTSLAHSVFPPTPRFLQNPHTLSSNVWQSLDVYPAFHFPLNWFCYSVGIAKFTHGIVNDEMGHGRGLVLCKNRKTKNINLMPRVMFLKWTPKILTLMRMSCISPISFRNMETVSCLQPFPQINDYK